MLIVCFKYAVNRRSISAAFPVRKASQKAFSAGTQDRVAAGIDPEGLGKSLWFEAELIYVIDHIPWTVYICVPKTIAVIPFFCQLIFVF